MYIHLIEPPDVGKEILRADQDISDRIQADRDSMDYVTAILEGLIRGSRNTSSRKEYYVRPDSQIRRVG